MFATNLATWYKSAKLKGIDQPKLESRIPVIDAIVKDQPLSFILDCLRIYLGKPPSSTTIKKELIEKFTDTDSFFEPKKNELEIQILCGAIIWQYVHTSKSKDKVYLLQSMKTGLFLMGKSEIINSEIANVILELQEKESLSTRESLKIDISKIQIDTTATEPTDLLTKFNTGLNKLVSQINSQIVRKLSLLDEETNIHWWIFTGMSGLRNMKFSKFDDKELAVIVAQELSQWTQAIPGPYPAENLILKLFSDANKENKEVAIKDLLLKAAKDDALPSPGVFSNLCPILFYVSICKDEKEAAQIKQKFENGTNLEVAHKITPTQFAFQLYNEMVSLKFYTA